MNLTFEEIDAQARKHQQAAFCLLTLLVIAVQLLLHTLFASVLGEPSYGVIVLLGFSFSLKALEVIWLQGRQAGITERTARLESSVSVVGIFILAGMLKILTNRDEDPYFVLLAVAILQCACQFQLVPTVLSIFVAIGMNFAWVSYFFNAHPPHRPGQYLETGMIAVIYTIMGVLVWYLVNQLKQRQAMLYEKMAELESTRLRLVAEEKLAGIGRLASGIAHEIRNPVAMISSALATAAYPESEPEDRKEMFAIASREAKRLENLTGDFLNYARPSLPQRVQISIEDIVGHIADVTRMRAAERSIDVNCRCDELSVTIDPAQVEAALLNLSLNAIDATPDRGRIELRARAEGPMLYLEVENSGAMIPESHLDRIFEPFFTTKSTGTGLGLAIARGVAIAHGGDLRVTSNRDGSVTFTMTLAAVSANNAR